MQSLFSRVIVGLSMFLTAALLHATEVFRVATYNVEGYLNRPTASRKNIKSAEAKAKIREGIQAMNPDVIAFEEIGEQSALLELRDSLMVEGLDFPFWEHITGWDTNIHVAVLSKFPFTTRHPHTNDTFLLSGRRFYVSRGFIELVIQVNTNYSFTLISAHLKSKRPVPEADEAELRLEEAKLLRGHIDARLAVDPNENIIVLGDFNDTHDSKPIKALVGRGKHKLEDTRPAERNGDSATNPANPKYEPRNVTWTHFYGVDDTYARIDYILLSPGMAREWVKSETYIPTIPNWGVASDHRPIVATFTPENRQ